MKVVILAGGYGTRIAEESHLKPKPMIEIGGYPILWHIMKYFSEYGHNDFIICCGYKQNIIKEFFANYNLFRSDITFDFKNNKTIIENNNVEPWKVTLVNTGLNTMTGGRIKKISSYLSTEPFLLTYGDGLCDVNLNNLIEYHVGHGKLATITAVQPGSRFGVLDISNINTVKTFKEKQKDDDGWINGGFMVLNPKIVEYIKDDTTIFEREPLENLAIKNELKAFKHKGFWQCMDTMRDKNYLEELLIQGNSPWKIWK